MRSALAAAIVLTALNACEPLVLDDTAYVLYARQIVAQPTDPYGFDVLWYDHPEPALHVTVPPVVPYWLAAGISLFGEHPAAWKLWLLPFAGLLAASLHALLRRLAPGLETPVLWMLLLSPAVLTSFNLMLDVPVLALGVAAIATTVRGLERGSLPLAALAGLLGGLALQTKYPGVVPLAAAVALALRARQPRIALVVGGVAGALFAGWEALMLLRYGESPFLYGLLEASITRDPSKPVLAWTVALVSILGATAAGAGLLGLAALGGRMRTVALAAGLASLAFLVVPFLPEAPLAFAGSSEPDFAQPRPELWLFAPLGLALVAVFAALARRRFAPAAGARPGVPMATLPPLWASLEVIGFFLFSPFPAVRRTIALGLALALWAAAGAASARTPPARVRGVAVWSAALGLLFFGADLSDAYARRDVVDEAIARVRALDPGGRSTVWFTGHWGFQYYAERAGARPVDPGVSALAAGDFLLVPSGVERQPLALRPAQLEAVARVTIASRSPWNSIPGFYTGPVPLRSQPDVHVAVRIYRARRDFVTAPARRPGAAPP